MHIKHPLKFETVSAYSKIEIGDVIRTRYGHNGAADNQNTETWSEVISLNQHHVSCTASIVCADGAQLYKVRDVEKLDDVSADAWRELNMPYVVGV